jgi:hypothetical protein
MLVVASLFAGLSPLSAQQLLDRIVARVGGSAITLTDVQAAVALGIVESRSGEDATASAEQQLIERELLLAEVARFPPPEPTMAAIDMEVAALKARAGTRLPALMQSTGLDDRRIREIARDTVRIQAYVNQRFGTAVVVTDDEVLQYYRARAALRGRGTGCAPARLCRAPSRDDRAVGAGPARTRRRRHGCALVGDDPASRFHGATSSRWSSGCG